MECYLDNSATTQCASEVTDLVIRAMREDYGNPSSMHLKGVEAEKYVKKASEQIAKTLKAEPKEILFTSGGTESDNLAIIGGAQSLNRRGRHLITTCIEHPAVLNTMAYLKKQGFEVTYLPVREDGTVDPGTVAEAMRPDTVLVSIMHTNNEIGTIEPIGEIGKLVHEKNPDCLFHVDAVQGYTKSEIIPRKMGIDLLSVSGHKIHGPKGVGFLYVGKNVRLLPQIHGGGQQNNLRSGTENVPGIAGLGLAAELGYRNFSEKTKRLQDLKTYFAKELQKEEEVFVNGPLVSEGAVHILNVSFTGVRSEVMLHALEDKGIFVSAGSACSSHKREPSATMKAIGLTPERMESALRFSFSDLTTGEELDYTLGVIHELLPFYRKYRRK